MSFVDGFLNLFKVQDDDFDYDKRFSQTMVWEEIKRMVPPEYAEEFQEKVRSGTNKFLIVAECQRRFGMYWNEDNK